MKEAFKPVTLVNAKTGAGVVADTASALANYTARGFGPYSDADAETKKLAREEKARIKAESDERQKAADKAAADAEKEAAKDKTPHSPEPGALTP